MVGRDVFIYSITIDPEHDDPTVLKKYADTFKAGPGWLFLTGKPEDISVIREKLGERSGNIISNHRNEWLLGNPATNDWFKQGIFEDLESVAANVRFLDPHYRSATAGNPTPQAALGNPKFAVVTNSTNVAASNNPAAYVMDETPGQSLYLKMCAMCHTIGKGDYVGPDLKGARSRHNLVWLTSFMKDPPAMLRKKDPEAVALAQRFPMVRMPALGISEHDAMDLLTYIDAEAKKQDDAAAGPAKPADETQPKDGVPAAKRASNDAQHEEPEHSSN